jgi:hypothetical protein
MLLAAFGVFSAKRFHTSAEILKKYHLERQIPFKEIKYVWLKISGRN